MKQSNLTANRWGVAGLLALVLGLAACAEPTQHVPAPSAQPDRLAIADLHFHPRLGMTPEQALGAMDQAGVRWAGNGVAFGTDDLWSSFVQAAPGRFLPFAGQGAVRQLIEAHGEKAWALRSPEIAQYLEGLEQDLRAGKFRGIGELFVNNLKTRGPNLAGTRYPADSPLMRRLLSLAAAYQAPLSIHMDADPASVAELERLLAADRKAVVIWAHCGFWADAALVRQLMAQHPNLFCEISYRDDRGFVVRMLKGTIMESGRRLKPDWKALLEDHSDRFLVGTDTSPVRGERGFLPGLAVGEYLGIIDSFRAILAQLTPESARRIAHENAGRLFRLAQ
jgi:predicted TIM-barrel fold metal-dependent hydrolase